MCMDFSGKLDGWKDSIGFLFDNIMMNHIESDALFLIRTVTIGVDVKLGHFGQCS